MTGSSSSCSMLYYEAMVYELQQNWRRARIALKGAAGTQARSAGFAATRSSGVMGSILNSNGRLDRSVSFGDKNINSN